MTVTLQSPFGVQCKPYGEARSAEFYFSVIIGWFCQSGLISSFWSELLTVGWRLILLFWTYCVIQMSSSFSDDFVIPRWISHFGMNLWFWAEFVWICHSEMNSSFLADFVIQGRICHCGQNCYSGLVSFWDMFIILGWLCHSGPNLSF